LKIERQLLLFVLLKNWVGPRRALLLARKNNAS